MEKYNDFELVALAQENCEEAINILYNKYKPIIVKKSSYALSFVSHHGIDIYDIMQEAYLAFDEAIRNFSESNDTTFYTFSLMCIDRHISNYIRKNKMGKNRLLNEAVTIDDSLEKTISNDIDIENDFLFKENYEDILEKGKRILTNFEYDVLKLRIDGYSFDHIAKVLNRDIKSIYNTLYRIKLKFQKIVKNDD